MKIIPIMTEKSMKLSKDNGFTFWVPSQLTKIEIKDAIEKNFEVHVTDVRTINSKAREKRSAKGQIQKIKKGKKAIVFLKDGEKIKLFEEEKKKTKKRSTKKS